MAAIAALTLADGKTPPVNHTFSPDNIDATGVAKYKDRSGGIALGYPTVSLGIRPPTKGSRLYRVTVKIATPILEVTSPSTSTGIQPAPTLAYTPLFTGEFVLSERSTLAERKDLLAYVKNMFANAVITSAVHDFESVY